MSIRQSLALLFFSFIAVLMFGAGCDELVTERINTTVIDTSLGVGCFNCHSDGDNSFLRPKGQWANSAHANPKNLDTALACGNQCHSHQGFIAEFDATGVIDTTAISVIGCFTCHKPHSFDYADWDDSLLGILRGRNVSGSDFLGNGEEYFISETDNSIMCVNCHQARFDALVPAADTLPVKIPADWGPHHSGQADIFSGLGGYDFGVTINVVNAHFTATANSQGCFSCHFGSGSGYDFGEHTFRLEDESTGEQFLKNCNTSGCHSATPITDFYSFPVIDSIKNNAATLETGLKLMGILDSNGDLVEDQNTSFHPDLLRSAYNYLLYKNDGSTGIHNSAFTNKFLSQTIDYLPMEASFTIDTNSTTQLCTGDSVTFNNISRGFIDSLKWFFGDTVVLWLPVPDTSYNFDSSITHVYNSPGNYLVKLYAYGKIPENIDSMISSATIDVSDSAIASFTDNLIVSNDSLNVTFTNTSTNGVFWLWDFGDTTSVNDTSSLQSPPAWTYSETGSFTVSLIASNSCNVDTLERIIVIDTTGGRVSPGKISISNK